MIVGRTARDTIRNPITDETIVEENQIITNEIADALKELKLESDPRPQPAHVREPARRLRPLLRHRHVHQPGRRGRPGRRHHRRPVDRRAGHAAHDAHVPHRRRRDRLAHRERHQGDRRRHRRAPRHQRRRGQGRRGRQAPRRPEAQRRNRRRRRQGPRAREVQGALRLPPCSSPTARRSSRASSSSSGTRTSRRSWPRRPASSATRTSRRAKPPASKKSARAAQAGEAKLVVIEHKGERHPRITIEGSDGKILDFHYLPAKARIEVKDGQKIEAGHMLARQPQGSGRHDGHHRRPAARDGNLRGPQAEGPGRARRDLRHGRAALATAAAAR